MNGYNRQWYIRDDDMVGAGKNYCYDHDEPNCKICPTCKDDLLCEGCTKERTKHTQKQAIDCLKYVGILYRNNKSINDGIAHFLTSTHVYDKLILSRKIRNPGEPKEIILAERIHIPHKIDT